MSARPLRLAIIASHPVQYYAPLFRALSANESIELRVFYTWSQAAGGSVYDPGFASDVKWDIPLLEGYAYQFVHNVSGRPGSDHFGGLRNPTLIADVESWHAQVVLVLGWNAHSHLQALRYFKGRVPVLFRGDSTLLDHQPWWRSTLRRWVLRWVYSHVDIAISVGTNNRDYFAWCGLPVARIALAPHSIDTARFNAGDGNAEILARQWRVQLGIGSGAIVFLYAGKLQEKKNPQVLLEAFSRLDAGCHLVYVGSGPMESVLKAQAAARKDVHFLPFQNQSAMPAVYRIGDVFVLPSRGPGETWGLALNEAMASGRAIIASSKVGAARDLIQPGKNGWMFEAGDAGALEGILRQAVKLGPVGLRNMGTVAQEHAKRWSTEESARCIGAAVLGCQAT